MSASFLLALLLTSLLSAAHARAAQTALDALKLLPKGVGKNLARIEAREGTPAPERWHILVHDAQSENGLREFVVADGKLVADRTLSQFAEKLTNDDVIGADSVKLNSDALTNLAEKYAVSNNVSISSMNYELRKENALPVWHVDCLDARGEKIGALSVAATDGKIVSREGFANEPTEKVTRADLDPSAPVAALDPVPTNTYPATTSTTRLPKEQLEKTRADSRRKVDERTARRTDERRPDAVAEPPVRPEDAGDVQDPGKIVAKKKPRTDVRRATPVNGGRDESVSGQPQDATTRDRPETARGERDKAPELEPFIDGPPRRPSVVRRIVRHLLPF